MTPGFGFGRSQGPAGRFPGRRFPALPGWALLGLLLLAAGAGCTPEGEVVSIGGGPEGSTFAGVASRIAFVLNGAWTEVRVRAVSSGGSVANLQKINEGRFDMGLVFAGDAWLGRQGRLGRGIPPQENVLALARLYGATAHLVVPAGSSVRTPFDLVGRRVAIGGSGTGSALTARRFFGQLKIYDRIVPIHEGYATAMDGLRQGNVDAVWLQVAFPSPFLVEAGEEMPLRFLDLFDPAVTSGFFSDFPFHGAARIPAGTYPGQAADVATFQDAALWVAHAGLRDETVFEALTLLFGEEGQARMRVLTVGWDLELEKGLMGVRIPLHPGAVRFWRARGIDLPGML